MPKSAVTDQPARTAFAQVRPCFPVISSTGQHRLGSSSFMTTSDRRPSAGRAKAVAVNDQVGREQCRATAESGVSVSSNRTVRERSTRQFQAVRDELARSPDFRSAQDIHAAMRAAGASVGLATVYRALQTLVEAGTADVLRAAAGQAVYRECGSTHHHHLVCRSCGKTIEVQGPAVETWAAEMAAQHGFADVSHTLELVGICSDCQPRP